MRTEFNVFRPKRSYRRLTTVLVLLPLLVLLVVYIGFGEDLGLGSAESIRSNGLYLGISLTLLLLLWSISRFGVLKATSGRLEGTLWFSDTEFGLNHWEFDIADVENLVFKLVDYQGMTAPGPYSLGTTPCPGVSNWLYIHYRDGGVEEIQFQREHAGQQLALRPFLLFMAGEGKIHEIHAADLLGISDPEEIRNLRKPRGSRSANTVKTP